jgi:hypothetical protein
MAESAALLVDEVFPEQPVRQWVLSVPFPLRFLFASRSEFMGRVLAIVYRCIATHLTKKAGFSRKTAQTGAVTLIQRFGSTLTKSLGAILNSRRLAPKGWRAGCPESPQCPLPYVVPRRGVRRASRRLAALPLGEGPDQPIWPGLPRPWHVASAASWNARDC